MTKKRLTKEQDKRFYEVLSIPINPSWSSRDYPHWLRFEGLCECDDGIFCVHRREYVKEFFISELDELEKENKTLIDFISAKNLAEYMENQLIEGDGYEIKS